MSRREGGLFVGRLNKHTRTRDVEDVFEQYGRLARCEVKYGAEMAYAFVDYEDRRDAEDAIRHENGRDLNGASIIVEWSKGSPRKPLQGFDECYKCHKVGHWARDCSDNRGSSRGGGGGYRRRSRSRSPRRRSHRSRSRSRDREPRDRKSRSKSRDRHRRRHTRSRSSD